MTTTTPRHRFRDTAAHASPVATPVAAPPVAGRRPSPPTAPAVAAEPVAAPSGPPHVPAPLPEPGPRWRRIGKGPRLMHHNRLIALVVIANVVVAVRSVAAGWWSADGVDLDAVSNVVLANIALAVLIRQQHVINLLFWSATRAPTSWPLAVRRTLGKVYHFGGLHVGGAVAGTAWYGAFVGALGYHLARGIDGATVPLVTVTAAILGLLLAMTATAWPSLRARLHDRFERTHRFAGWAVLALFWAQTVLVAADAGDGGVATNLGGSVAFWTLIVLTGSVALPWLRLRRVPVEITTPSSHVALTRFDHGVTPFAGSSTAVSRSPLLEWHSFANVPSPGEDGFRLTISRAGDWTGSLIDDPPSHLWVKGIPTAGVANIEVLFTKVVYVATGSGIGPCLPHLLAGAVPSHLVWATRNPRRTYGDELVDEILAVQPDALIWDTDAHGKPDLVALAHDACRRTGAEAAICISNKKVTWQVVEGLEVRGIPAYGAIWDS